MERTAAIYARQSVDKKDSISIDSQVESCEYELKGEGYQDYREMKTTRLIQFNYSCRNFIFGCIYKSEFAPKRTQCTQSQNNEKPRLRAVSQAGFN